MLLWFAKYGHTRYTPWGTVYAADTDQLEISCLEHVNKVGKDLIGITQSDSARDTSLAWKLMTRTISSSNKQLRKSRVRAHFLNSLGNSHS